MNSKKLLQHFLFVLLSLLPAIYLLAVWNTVPEQVPLHFNGNFEPDRYGSKNELWSVAAIMSGVSLLVYFLLRNIHKIDPKRAKTGKPAIFNKLANCLVIFLSAIGLVGMIASTRQDAQILERMMMPLIGLMFIFLGNYMYSVKPNYFLGIRTPWALNDDENWRRTHRVGGTLWFAGGVLILIIGLLGPKAMSEYVFLTIVILMVLIPFGYSFILFRKRLTKIN